MTKKKKSPSKTTTPSSVAASPAKPTRRALLAEAQKIDLQLMELLEQRAELVKTLDATDDRAAFDLAQRIANDTATVQHLVSRHRGVLPEESIARIFRILFSAARSLSSPIRIAYLGPQFTYSYQAAVQYFGSECEYLSVSTIPTVFEEVDQGHADYGVVPLENSTDGRVSDTLDMFLKVPVKICGEIKLPIRHCLLARCRREKIQQVFSKPQALSQCRGWLAKHLPQATATPSSSTSAAAQLAAQTEGGAAIASADAAEQFGLDVVDADIQDHPFNLTRFAVIGRNASPKSGSDKTSFLFGLPHEPGALADILNIFKRNRLNMSWIESYPDPDEAERYLFFVEVHGHESDTKMRHAIDALEKRANRVELLGSYRRAESTKSHERDGHNLTS